MPEISLIPEVLHDSSHPYHFTFDNLPLKNIIARIDLVNAQVDLNADILRNGVGTAGTLSNRLNQSLEASGALRTVAVDNSLHNIAFHADGQITVSGVPVDFVRMQKSERDKLTLVDDQANALDVEVEGVSTTTLFTNGTVRIKPSSTITWTIEAPDVIKASTVFPVAAAHNHFYDLLPAHVTPSSPNFINYKTTSVSTPFIAGSLRVWVNGILLSAAESVYVPSAGGFDSATLTTIASQSATGGTFSLNRALAGPSPGPADVVRIAFDTVFT